MRTHPDTLLITARNKMASGMDVIVERDISLIGRGVESARLYSDKSRNLENLAQVDGFLDLLVQSRGVPEPSPHGGALLWREVPATTVADMLEKFLIHPLNFAFQGESIAEFLRQADARDDPDLSSWTVVLPTAGDRRGSPTSITSRNGDRSRETTRQTELR